MSHSDCTPRDVLQRYQQAMMEFAADNLADLYAPDAIHEFPFLTPGQPAPLTSQVVVRDAYRDVGASTCDIVRD